jgi:hypothetical protein
MMKQLLSNNYAILSQYANVVMLPLFIHSQACPKY